MLCDNCGKREANVRYSENINGRKKELNLCEECSHKLGIDQMDFSMPIDFSNFFEGFMDNFGSNEFMPMLSDLKTLRCNSCGYTFDDIANTGRLGCKDCYSVFEDRLDPIIKVTELILLFILGNIVINIIILIICSDILLITWTCILFLPKKTPTK